MTVNHLEVLVEEPSMEAALEHLLPNMLPSISFTLHAHQGKINLLSTLPSKLKAYARWIPASYRILIIVDRDDEDCVKLKARLEKCAIGAGLVTKSAASKSDHFTVINRVVVQELEAWYFGDWEAVHAAYPRVPVNVPSQTKYRAPDDVAGGTWENFERILQRAGYFKTGLRKIEAARAIAAHMDPARNSSPSFQILRNTLTGMVESP